jgi:tetratricopeptide (TPR) repeat protein
MLFITQTASQFGSPQQFMREEVPADMKHNIEIWETFLLTTVPRWGGSYQKMKQIITKEVPAYLPKLSDQGLQTLHDVETYDRVDTLIRSEHYEIALKLAEKSINSGSLYTGIYTRAATAAHKLNNVQKCLTYSLKATQLRPWKAKAWNKRGQCAIDRQLWQQANEAYRHKVFIDGVTKYGLFKLGQTYMYLSQFDKAYAVFQKAVELDPKYTEYTDMYTHYIEKEKPDQMGLEGKDIYLIIGEP